MTHTTVCGLDFWSNFYLFTQLCVSILLSLRNVNLNNEDDVIWFFEQLCCRFLFDKDFAARKPSVFWPIFHNCVSSTFENKFKFNRTIMNNHLKGVHFPLDRFIKIVDICLSSQVSKKWRDSKCVNIVSTKCSSEPIEDVQRIFIGFFGGKYSPATFPRYIAKMGGVDTADQLQYYKIFKDQTF